MKPVAFEYCRPDSLGEALDLLAERRERAAVLAGGMSLGPMLNLRMVRPDRVIDISRLGGLDGIEVRGDRIVTGATVIQADALDSAVIGQELPLLALRRGGPSDPHAGARRPVAQRPERRDPAWWWRRTWCCALAARAPRVRAREFFVGALARRAGDLIPGRDRRAARASRCGACVQEIAQHGDAIAAVACEIRPDAARPTRRFPRSVAWRIGLSPTHGGVRRLSGDGDRAGAAIYESGWTLGDHRPGGFAGLGG
jgi:hypothetical protein